MDARSKRKRDRWRKKRAEKAQTQAIKRNQMLRPLLNQRIHEGIRDQVLKEVIFNHANQ